MFFRIVSAVYGVVQVLSWLVRIVWYMYCQGQGRIIMSGAEYLYLDPAVDLHAKSSRAHTE